MSLVRRSAPAVSPVACPAGSGVCERVPPCSDGQCWLQAQANRAKQKGAQAPAKTTTRKAPVELLHLKYRPKKLDDVVGQEHVTTNIASLYAAERMPHTYLFTGPSGVGKTTLARIVASMIGCSDVIEHDAARFNSIQSVRELVDGAQYGALGDNAGKFFILDECHRISAAAFDVLLKATEEPPEHLYWAFCTTEPDKIPKTLRTRSHAYELTPIAWDVLADYLEAVKEAERLNVPKEFIDIAARRADGSVRQALVYLSMLDGITDREQALKLVEDYDSQEHGPVQLARLLVSGKGLTWASASKVIAELSDVGAETIRLTVLNYATAAAAKETGEKSVQRLLAIMAAFSAPCNPSERMAPIYLAVGSLLFE